jgi:hypothetical protein
MMKDLSEQLNEVRAASAPAAEGMTELLTAMTGMMKQNQDILGALVAAKAPAASNGVARK